MKLGKYQAAAVVAIMASVTLVALYALGAAEDVRRAVAWLGALVGPVLTAWLTRDSDGDGAPDVVDADPQDPKVH